MIVGMLSQSITIGATTIGKLLKEERLEVPPNQRAYRWKPEHAEDLFKDIRKEIDNRSDEYFLGSIVSIETSGKILIYDGQQRLATTMILLAEIRNALIDLDNEKDANIVERSFLFSERRGGADAIPHLTLNLEDKEFFFARILPRPNTESEKPIPTTRPRDSHKRLESVARAANEFVEDSIMKKGSPEESYKNLNRWVDFIEKSLQVIWVQVTNERTAFTIFETMNDRGLKLSAADLLKNYLHATAEGLRNDVIQKWASMTGTLETVEGEEENVVEYIRCFWVSRYGHTRTRYLYDKIKDRITNPGRAIALLSSLEEAAQDYAAIIMASHERTTDRGEHVKSNIATLKTLGVTQLRPMLLSAFAKLKHGQFDKLLEKSVVWSVRFMVTGTPSGTIEGYYAKIAADIWSGKTKTAKAAADSIKQIVPEDEEFKIAFANVSESKEKIARYYLQALQFAKDKSTLRSDLTLEHILPKKRDDNWKHFSEDDHRANVHRLGNLTPMDEEKNGAIQGKGYDFKRTIFAADADSSLTRDVAKYDKWTMSAIAKRQKELAEIAVVAWPLK
ncbi:MAG: hypothetical protein DME22_12585 [Verrucomicrobia bacterium]|nr:MAG: hypothetical protein DME22_12585 [Verrucomicrobiota bacterium]